jgi:hypothetical protein
MAYSLMEFIVAADNFLVAILSASGKRVVANLLTKL